LFHFVGAADNSSSLAAIAAAFADRSERDFWRRIALPHAPIAERQFYERRSTPQASSSLMSVETMCTPQRSVWTLV
jgi:hypothetical protein